MAMFAEVGMAQVYRSIAPPPATLPLDLTGVGSVSSISFDPFATTGDTIRLYPWQTTDIPPGSWGNISMWGPEKLEATTIDRHRQAFIQKIQLGSGFINRDSIYDAGNTFASADITMVVPIGTTDSLVVLKPAVRVDWMDGPSTIDIPAQLHSVSMDIGWRRIFNSRWSLIAGIQPGLFTDFETGRSGFRMGGLGMLSYQLQPDRLTVVAGVVYLDRNDVSVLPAVGLTWIPNADTRFDLTFPKPRISRRVSHLPYLMEDWVYLAASFGGGSWSVVRSSGLNDELTLRDFRASVGFERILDGGTGYFIDVGYVFGRKLEYESVPLSTRFGDSFVIEAGLSF